MTAARFAGLSVLLGSFAWSALTAWLEGGSDESVIPVAIIGIVVLGIPIAILGFNLALLWALLLRRVLRDRTRSVIHR